MNNSNRSLKAIVFDFDGTLAKLNIDFPQMRKSVIELIESYGVPLNGIIHLFVLEMIGAGKDLISKESSAEVSVYIKQAYELIEYIEMEAAKNSKLIDGTREMLQELKNRKIKMGIVTRNCRAAILRVFPDIYEYFDSVITREQTSHVKPHPEHLRLIIKTLHVEPELASMVGDHPMDIKIGRDVGTLTIGVLTGASSMNDLIQAEADIILQKAADLLDVVS
jgi:phosphoglycolate phosphatase